MSGALPERRTNHCSFIVGDYYYIHGGRDIKVGSMNNMWRLSLNSIHDLLEDPETPVSWDPVEQRGNVPSNISHHRPAVFGHTVVVFGGITEHGTSAYEFDSEKNSWSMLKQTGQVPKTRDDHSLSVIDDKSFLIFGGFVDGSRVNETYVARKNGSTLEWTQIGDKSAEKPCIRASSSAIVHSGKCYVFGGMSDDNIKLNDLWVLDMDTQQWSEITLPEKSYQPSCRSGHSAQLYNGKMIIFGGILELTKELNEMLIYDFKTGIFDLVGEAHNDDLAALQVSHKRPLEAEGAESPLTKKGTLKKSAIGGNMSSESPTKLGRSPTKIKSPTKLTSKARRAGKEQ